MEVRRLSGRFGTRAGRPAAHRHRLSFGCRDAVFSEGVGERIKDDADRILILGTVLQLPFFAGPIRLPPSK
jgi:hypothetical protein